MKKINNALIVAKLMSRLQLSNIDYSPFVLSDTVYPTTDLDSLLKDTKITVSSTQTLTGSGTGSIFVCPAGERHYLVCVNTNFVSVTASTFSSFFISIGPTGTDVCTIYKFTASNAGQVFFLPQKIRLNPGDSVKVTFGTNTNGDTWSGSVITEVEKIF